eukprot:Clim_evm221s157 gene=Clim_evmTU221s157
MSPVALPIEDDMMDGPERRHSRRLTIKEHSKEELGGEDQDEQSVAENGMEHDSDEPGEQVRRSGRNKRLRYETLNIDRIEKKFRHAEIEEEEIAGRRGRRGRGRYASKQQYSSDEEEEEEEEEESEPETEYEEVVLEPTRPGLRPRRILVRKDPEGDEDHDDEGHENEDGEKNYNLRRRRAQVERYAPEPRQEDHFEPRSRGRGRPRTRRESDRSVHVPRRGRPGASSRYYNERRGRSRDDRRSRRRDHDSDASDDDDVWFEKKQARSILKRLKEFAPVNFNKLLQDDHGGHRLDLVKERMNNPSNAQPMDIDKNVTFKDIGGLDNVIQALKETAILPLLYDDFFQAFNVKPPRGLLLAGPPGTGKTLAARALANECNINGKSVAFFLRKGADVLSKWVGESERQLRLLFEQAYAMRPSIIFFDEIDGLAPARSGRTDQMHNSVVSTLLALMDGMDDRGQVIIIGATNRVESLDPALRRPGRFDREIKFQLPSLRQREAIIRIHTKTWNPPLSDSLVRAMALRTHQYSGADIKALVSDIALRALRRSFPQIYDSTKRLKINLRTVRPTLEDFTLALHSYTPNYHRVHTNVPKLPSPRMRCLFSDGLKATLEYVEEIRNLHSLGNALATSAGDRPEFMGVLGEAMDSGAQAIDAQHSSYGAANRKALSVQDLDGVFDSARSAQNLRMPRIIYLVNEYASSSHCADVTGMNTVLAPIIMNEFTDHRIVTIDAHTLYADPHITTAEEAIVSVFRGVTDDCVVFLPSLEQMWSILSETAQVLFEEGLRALSKLKNSVVVVTFTSHEHAGSTLTSSRFYHGYLRPAHRMIVESPNREKRVEYALELLEIVQDLPSRIEEEKERAKARESIILEEEITKAQLLLNKEDRETFAKREEQVRRELRIFLRDIVHQLMNKKRFRLFMKPLVMSQILAKTPNPTTAVPTTTAMDDVGATGGSALERTSSMVDNNDSKSPTAGNTTLGQRESPLGQQNSRPQSAGSGLQLRNSPSQAASEALDLPFDCLPELEATISEDVYTDPDHFIADMDQFVAAFKNETIDLTVRNRAQDMADIALALCGQMADTFKTELEHVKEIRRLDDEARGIVPQKRYQSRRLMGQKPEFKVMDQGTNITGADAEPKKVDDQSPSSKKASDATINTTPPRNTNAMATTEQQSVPSASVAVDSNCDSAETEVKRVTIAEVEPTAEPYTAATPQPASSTAAIAAAEQSVAVEVQEEDFSLEYVKNWLLAKIEHVPVHQLVMMETVVQSSIVRSADRSSATPHRELVFNLTMMLDESQTGVGMV